MRVWCLPDDEGRRVGEEAKPGIDMVNSKVEEVLGKTAMEETQKRMKGLRKDIWWGWRRREEEDLCEKGEKKGKVEKQKETHMKRKTEAAKDLMKCLERKRSRYIERSNKQI